MAKTKAHTRYLTPDHTIVPGVTTILGVLAKPALVPWANKLGLQGIDVGKYVDDKAAIGTLAHAMITDTYLDRITDLSDYSSNQIDAATNSVLSFLEWELQHPVARKILIEVPLVSEVYGGYGGAPDLFLECEDGARELIDLKTGKGIYREHHYQVAAYRHLLLENGHGPVDRVRILNIPRTEDESFIEHVMSDTDLNDGLEIFLHCLSIYNLQKKRG